MNFRSGLALSMALMCGLFSVAIGCAKLSSKSNGGVVSVFAGQLGVIGSADGKANASSFNYPSDVVLDRKGNIYVADYTNLLIRKITSDGTVTTLAGKAKTAGAANGSGQEALFQGPADVAVDPSGNVYVQDIGNGKIRKITPEGMVSNFPGADSPAWTDVYGKPVAVNSIGSLAVDESGNLYVVDNIYFVIRKITPEGSSSILAGSGSSGTKDGKGSEASFSSLSALTLGADGNLYAADASDHAIRKITPKGVMTTVAGGGDGSIKYVMGLVIDPSGNIFVSCQLSALIQKITPEGKVSTLAGPIEMVKGTKKKDGSAYPSMLGGIAMDSSGALYLADAGNQVIRKIR